MPRTNRTKPSPGADSLPKRPSAPKVPHRYSAAWTKWEEAAKKFNGLDDRLMSKTALRQISLTKFGYQVRVTRGGRKVFDRCVLGRSEESLLEAMRVRDEALRQWPSTLRTNKIPARVLRALGLASPVIGICRWPGRSVYRVYYRDGKSRHRLRQFYFRVVSEEVAYAAAIDFLKSTHR